MIFATVGTQIPFDRLIRILDQVAPMLDEEIIAQTSAEAKYKPENIRTVAFLPPAEFNAMFDSARLVVAHAGMGTIISAMTARKPIILFPRRASLGEHRNDHQMATARQLEDDGAITVAYDADTLRALLLSGASPVPAPIADTPSRSLIEAIMDYIG